MTKLQPQEIETKSMEIIQNKVNLSAFSQKELPVVMRVIHTTGDLEIHRDIRFSSKAVTKGLEALTAGADIFTDVNMVTAGLNKSKLKKLGSKIHCKIADENVAEEAHRIGSTRAETAFKTFGENLHGNIVVIGNAPTALFKLLELVKNHNITPALVVGVPVGFVGAKESKDALMNSDLPYISISGYKGGSPIGASVINALLKLL
ncbi:precorrin-8X methylmutase [Natranaerobius thermophilus]|uniref:Precorrin-8X methylmutase n=1 Tax=Natranaerobius thermophilus (strain ATCC BAA-1301 / DSM 18059 / JW/NM-WN-LF) TaxID=457570 RepID=B2A0F1_NATTJ|nr:precorrin-8X methylmutase [Natranaerobius thermophilus]ACB84512.1 Precorrin-8X methylmutase [Natranaerobius thermophilus JW/NM-WN-LF]